QRGEPDPDDRKAKPKRATIPKDRNGETLTLEEAIGLLSLPREVGPHPETGEMITAGLGRFGPFVKMGSIYGTLSKDDDVLTIGLNRAVDALAKKLASIRTLGTHPKDGEVVMVRKGRFGPYVQHGQTIATLPKGDSMDDVTLEEALTLLDEKGKPLKGGRKTTTKKTAAKKTTTRKTTTAKSTTRKTATKKAATGKATSRAKTTKSGTTKTGSRSKTSPEAPISKDDLPF
ncbi:topoisomerase C-terminal repeat-containing protein, partial [Bombella apis]|uniref:topoisomerase C-terminal repeat-containing protein n=1 Tax=Bombella apis TaxID=1785988 RepID=UPI0023F874F5